MNKATTLRRHSEVRKARKGPVYAKLSFNKKIVAVTSTAPTMEIPSSLP
jgi:hypothetical protein